MPRLLQQFLFLFLAILSFATTACADEFAMCGSDAPDEYSSCEKPKISHPHNQFYIAPELYHVKRTKVGGSEQTGVLYGGQIGYDRFKRYGWYVGFEGLYATGHLKGYSGKKERIKSDLSDAYAEGRFGYTFQQKCGYHARFTPYLGGGYFRERNNFKNPSPVPAHFNTHYWYAAVGFLSQASLTPRYDLGLNFKAKFIYDPRCKVTHDPKSDNFTQLINEKVHYRVEVPLTYHYWEGSDKLMFSLVPFYEYRRYGFRVNFPADFIDTRFNLYGAFLKVIYSI